MLPHTPRIRPLAACLALAIAGSAAAETSPYYIGASEALTYQTNIFSSTTGQIDSGISSASVIGGFDQPIGRQRVYANATLGHNYFMNDAVRYLNNNSYGLNAGLDWQTVERLSGTVRVAANQTLAFYGTAGAPTITQRNIQNVGSATFLAHYGITPRIKLDAGYEYRYLNYSAPAYAYEEFKQKVVSLGLSYGQTDVLKVGAGLRLTKADYPNYLVNPDPITSTADPYLSDTSTGKNIDFTVVWVPTGSSSLDARLSFTDIAHTINKGADFHGLTGALGWNYQVSGKLATRLSFLVAPGTGATYLAFTGIGPTTVENSTLSKILRLSATYAATGKTTLTGNIGVAQNRYGQTTNLGTQRGTDLTPRVGLGVSYAPTRNTLLACNANYQKRSASDEAVATGQSYPYSSSNVSCSGQITLQ